MYFTKTAKATSKLFSDIPYRTFPPSYIIFIANLQMRFSDKNMKYFTGNNMLIKFIDA
jgi:hypothetical protein